MNNLNETCERVREHSLNFFFHPFMLSSPMAAKKQSSLTFASNTLLLHIVLRKRILRFVRSAMPEIKRRSTIFLLSTIPISEQRYLSPNSKYDIKLSQFPDELSACE